MSEPYTPDQIARALRTMPDERLAAAVPRTFQTWPVRKIVKSSVIAELISNERASRRANHG